MSETESTALTVAQERKLERLAKSLTSLIDDIKRNHPKAVLYAKDGSLEVIANCDTLHRANCKIFALGDD